MYIERNYKELTHVIMKADKSPSYKLDNQESRGCSSSPKACSLEAQEEPLLELRLKARKSPTSKPKASVQSSSLLFRIWFYRPLTAWMGPVHIRHICSAQSTNANVSFTQRHLPRHTQNYV